MKCRVCGEESGKYVLCRNCNEKREKGLIIKCEKCNNWHYKDSPCNENSDKEKNQEEEFLYKLKKTLITVNEQEFFKAIKDSIPKEYNVFPQINLAAIIEKTDDSRFRNELFRNIDFLITNEKYEPKIAIEINDQTHLSPDRRERDEKVKKICEEAGIPIINLWTSYGVNIEYIKERINKTLSNLPIERIHHFQNEENKTLVSETVESNNTKEKNYEKTNQTETQNQTDKENQNENKTEGQNQSQQTNQTGGCYIATCVYGDYDSPKVMVLRNYRDYKLSKSICGRAFIKTYYKISPTLVKWFGNNKWFKTFWRKRLDKMIEKIQRKIIVD